MKKETSNPSVCGGQPIPVPGFPGVQETELPAMARLPNGTTEFLGEGTRQDVLEAIGAGNTVNGKAEPEPQVEKEAKKEVPQKDPSRKSALFTGAHIDFLRGHLNDDPEDLPDDLPDGDSQESVP